MNEKQAHTVKRLKDYLIDNYDPEVIILYGSTARGDTDEFSDIDMMVIMDVEDNEKVTAEMLSVTDHIVHDKHIILRSCDDYYNQKDIPGTMVYSALSEGLILFRRPGFDMNALPLKGYEERKKYVIEKEYLHQSGEFLGNSKNALESRQLFRCRDNLRFAAVRALKAVLVFRDIHPPRSTDLEELFEMARELLPEIGKLQPLIEALDKYIPGGNDTEENVKCRDLLSKVNCMIDIIMALLC